MRRELNGPALRARGIGSFKATGFLVALKLPILQAIRNRSIHAAGVLVVCLRIPKVILLADLQPGLPQNVVGGGDMEVHIR